MIFKNCVVSFSLIGFTFVYPPGGSRLKVLHYSKADWQQKNTDTWLSSESRHERVVKLAPLVATGGDDEIDGDNAAAVFKVDGLTLIVPVLDADDSLAIALFEEDAVSPSSR